ncbi:MAG: response regulator, partial [Chloroflexi bacterium]|nr:response regulator [Chloroflexota bacterium]
MATILVVDDSPTNREFLVTLLQYAGHRLLEAADGAEGLATARAGRPDLIIADILMPTMDGFEFVRQVRADPAIAQSQVIFCTAAYQEHEARNLARKCGVTEILTKPAEPEDVLHTVSRVLGLSRPPVAPSTGAEFDREHLRLLTDKLSQKVAELEAIRLRLAPAKLSRPLAPEHDLEPLLEDVSAAGRQLIGATYEALRESEQRLRQLAENIHQVFWMTDAEQTRMLYVSPAYEEVWGVTCQSLYERPLSFLDAVHPEDQERVRLA